jgi:multidrug efflux pump subunit AcrA (membrane-fusion protein)
VVPALSDAGSDTFEVWITVPNKAHLLFTGQSVYARLMSHQKMITVPELAVVNRDSDSIIFVYSGGRAHLRHVLIGARDGDRIGIVNGLQEGDQVVLIGQHQLTDGSRVNPVAG